MKLKNLVRVEKLFNSEQTTILSAATVIAVVYGFSAFLGFIRNRLLSGYFGDTNELGIYLAADAIPNLIFSLTVSGSLSSAFIPAFVKEYKRDQNSAWQVTSVVMNLALVFFLIFSLLVYIFAYPLSRYAIAWGSSLSMDDITLLASLTRVMIFAQIILILSSFFTSILQSFNKFFVPALAPFVYNLGVIIGILLFVDRFGIYAPAYGMIIGALMHLCIQVPLVRKIGFKHFNSFDFRNPKVLEVYKHIVPRTFGQAAQNITKPIYANLALFISGSANVILNFANDAYVFPLKLFGLSIGQAALPMFSHAASNEDESVFKSLIEKTIRQVVFLLLPASILVFVLRLPLVRLTVGSSKYSWPATVMTSYSLGFFCASLISQALIMILARAFYAKGDTKTPLKISLFSILVNIVLAVFFVRYLGLGVWSLALSYSISSIINFTLLFLALNKRLNGIVEKPFLRSLNSIFLASYVMGIALYLPYRAFDELIIDTTRTVGLIVLTFTVASIGFFVYIGACVVFKIRELEMVIDGFLKTKNYLLQR